MLASPFVAIVLRYWKAGLIALLCLGLAVQTVRISSLKNDVEREKINANELRAELKAISTKKNEQKAETSKRIEQAERGNRDADERAERIERAPTAPNCETPPEIMSAEL